MKLSNLSVIFIVLAIPLILILSYYISLQRDTINMQTSYNTKLLDSTKEAIEAFEINTVEWNEAYSETADSKRRDVMASINTFTTALANNLGVSGTSKEYLLTHIPAIAFTLYDGFYIYSPSETKFTVKNKNGVTQFMSEDTAKSTTGYTFRDEDNGKILYEANPSIYYDGIYKYQDSDGNDIEKHFTLNPDNAIGTKDYQSQDYPHILKPFTVYSEAVTSGTNKMIINYTLDNYLTVYGEINGEYTSNSGYLNVTSLSQADSTDDNGIYIANSDFTGRRINDIYFSGMHIQPELLSETIVYKDEVGLHTENFNYVYESQKDTKIYYDGRFFRLNNDLEKVYIEDLTEPLYKKCTVPAIIEGEQSCLKVYQSLVANPDGSYTWYVKPDSSDEYYATDISSWHSSFSNPVYDYSAINYCVETYIFTNWVNGLTLKYADGTQIKIDKTNDPEYQYSTFSEHKREVIKNIVISNLNQAITSYSRKTKEKYRLPMLKETEWDQVLSNVSIITFLQNIPIGLKYYNNYAIATSTLNKEYVDPEEIYIYNQDTSSDLIYHTPYCDKLTTDNDLIGYRSIDYMYKEYEKSDEEKGYYFKHTDNSNSRQVNQACYYCLVQRALYEENITDKKKDAYYTTLARERYIQLDEPIIGEETIEIDVEKNVDTATKRYGDNIIYTITVTNNGTNDKVIAIEDIFDNVNVNEFINNINVSEGTLIVDGKRIIVSDITLPVGTTKDIIIQGKVIGNVGIHTNTAKAWVDGQEFVSNPIPVKVVKDIKIIAESVMKSTNIVFIIDASASMVGSRIQNVQNAVVNFVNRMTEDGVSQIGYVKFYTIGAWFAGVPYGNAKGPYLVEEREDFIDDLEFGADANLISATPFATGLRRGRELLEQMQTSAPGNMDIAIFLSDGVNFYIEVPNYKIRADELQSVADRVYAIGYKAELATNFDTLRDDIASREEYFKESNDMGQVFDEIFEDIAIEIDETINGEIINSSATQITGVGANMIGSWISLRNSSEYDFSIDLEDNMNGIDINSTMIRINVNGSTVEEDTLVGLSNKGYIGKAYESVYLNLDKFEAADQITVEVVQ